MNKETIFLPRKSYKAASNFVISAVLDLGIEVATEIGLEVLKVDGLYYTVRNTHKTPSYVLVLSTDDAVERYTAAQIVGA